MDSSTGSFVTTCRSVVLVRLQTFAQCDIPYNAMAAVQYVLIWQMYPDDLVVNINDGTKTSN